MATIKTITAQKSESHSTATSFHLFPHLPLEIQDMIWELAVADAPPRVFEWRTDLTQDDRYPGEWSQTTACHPPPRSHHPTIQQVCRRARHAATRRGLRSLRLPAQKTVPIGVSLDDSATTRNNTASWHHRALPATAPPRRERDISPLFNTERDIVLLQDTSLLQVDTVTTHNNKPEPESPSLPPMAMSEIRNVAFEVQSRFETWDDAYWGCVLPHLRRTFPSMKTLSPVLLEHDQNGFDVVTGWPRQSPWLRDGSDAVGQGFEVRAAPITGLVPVRGGVRNNEVWATFSARIERLRRETPGCEGLEVVMQLAERDWTPLRKPWTNRKTPMSVNRQVLGLSSINGGSCWEPQSNWIWGHRFEMAAR